MARAQSRKRKRGSGPQYQTFIFRIEDWEPTYGFSINRDRFRDSAYSEHLQLAVSGVFLAPARAEGRKATLDLIGDRSDTRAVSEPSRLASHPTGVGALTLRGERTHFIGSLPYDGMWGLIGLLSDGAVRMIQLHGPALYRGKTHIASMHFVRDIDPEDW